MTWDDVCKHLRGRYRVARDEPGWLGITFETAAGPVRSLVKRHDGARPCVAMTAHVCHDAENDLFALAVEQDAYSLRVTLLLDALGPVDLEWALEFVVVEASRLERATSATEEAATC